ncbi:MAG TPA: tetratricopeptide repeat protein [Elusimicrobiota bacterium]|nr:tetratricopeptide repeat protein [Elusimicrobiota bacterium]
MTSLSFLVLAFALTQRAAAVGVSSAVVSAESDISQERYPEAAARLEPFLREKPDDSRAILDLALAYHGSGRYDEEADLLERAQARRPGRYALDIQLAKAELSRGRLTQAKDAFARAKKTDGKASEAYIQEGYSRLMAGEADASRAEFQQLIAVDTASPWGYYHMGGYFDRLPQADMPRSEHYFRRAFEIARAAPKGSLSDLLPFLLSLGDVLVEEGRLADAESLYKGALKDRRDAGTECAARRLRRELATVEAGEGKTEAAEAAFRAAADGGAACQDRPSALLALAGFEAGRSRFAEAKAAAEESYSGFAGLAVIDHLEEFDQLAAVLAAADDAGRAETLFRKVIAACGALPAGSTRARDESIPFSAAAAKAEMGMAGLSEAAGKPREAEDFYRRAVAGFHAAGMLRREAAAEKGLAEIRRERPRPAR